MILYSDMWLTNFFSSDASAFLKNCEISAFNTSFLLLNVRNLIHFVSSFNFSRNYGNKVSLEVISPLFLFCVYVLFILFAENQSVKLKIWSSSVRTLTTLPSFHVLICYTLSISSILLK